MAYVKIIDYAAKDALLTGNPAKLIKGVDIGAEFDAVAAASALTVDLTSVQILANKSISGSTNTLTNIPGANVTGTVPLATSASACTGNSATATLATSATDTVSKTGTGSTYVTNTSPTLVTPNLGTPSTLVGTNITGTAAGLSIGGNAATASNGGVTSINGQTGAVVDTTLYAIGSYVTGRPANVTQYAVNSTIAGTSLYATPTGIVYAAADDWAIDAQSFGNTATAAAAGYIALVNTGTWRCMSPAVGYGATTGYAGLWVRIS